MMPSGHYLNPILGLGQVRRVLHYDPKLLIDVLVVHKTFKISKEKVYIVLVSHSVFGLDKLKVDKRLSKYALNKMRTTM